MGIIPALQGGLGGAPIAKGVYCCKNAARAFQLSEFQEF